MGGSGPLRPPLDPRMELLRIILPGLVFEISNFTNELSKNLFNVCRKVQIESTLINKKFFKI